MPHGQFESWCDENLPVKARQRQKWMARAKAYCNAPLPDTTIDEALGYKQLPGPDDKVTPFDEEYAEALTYLAEHSMTMWRLFV